MYYIYVLKSLKDGKNYTGMTVNLDKRLKEHNIGRINTPSTKTRGPFRLIYSEKVEDRKIACQREKYFKTGFGRKFLKDRI